jgi:hypothetical protein
MGTPAQETIDAVRGGYLVGRGGKSPARSQVEITGHW